MKTDPEQSPMCGQGWHKAAVLLTSFACSVAALAWHVERRLGFYFWPPQLVCEVPVYDFGSAQTGTSVSHTFVLRNTGRAVLQIQDVKPDCRCAVAALATRRVPSGGSVGLSAKLSLAETRGRTRTQIVVTSSDAHRRSLVLSLQGNVQHDLRTEPSTIVLKDERDAFATLDVVANVPDVTFRLRSAVPSHPCLEVACREYQPGKAYQLLVRRTSIAGKDLEEYVEITTDHPREWKITVPVIRLPANVR